MMQEPELLPRADPSKPRVRAYRVPCRRRGRDSHLIKRNWGSKYHGPVVVRAHTNTTRRNRSVIFSLRKGVFFLRNTIKGAGFIDISAWNRRGFFYLVVNLRYDENLLLRSLSPGRGNGEDAKSESMRMI